MYLIEMIDEILGVRDDERINDPPVIKSIKKGNRTHAVIQDKSALGYERYLVNTDTGLEQIWIEQCPF